MRLFQPYLAIQTNKKLETPNMLTSTDCKRFGILLAFSGEAHQRRVQRDVDEKIDIAYALIGTNENDPLLEAAHEGVEARRRVERRGLVGTRADVILIRPRLIQCNFDASFIKDDASFEDFAELIVKVKANIDNNDNNVCVFLHFSAHGHYNTIEQDTFIHFIDGRRSLKEIVHILQALIDVNDLKLIITVDACRDAEDTYVEGKITQGNECSLPDNVLVIYSCQKGESTYEPRYSEDDFAYATPFSSAVADNISVGYSTEVFFDKIETTMQNHPDSLNLCFNPDREGQCDFVF